MKLHRQMRVPDLPKVTKWWLERDSNPRPFGRKAPNLPMSYHAHAILVMSNVDDDEDDVAAHAAEGRKGLCTFMLKWTFI